MDGCITGNMEERDGNGEKTLGVLQSQSHSQKKEMNYQLNFLSFFLSYSVSARIYSIFLNSSSPLFFIDDVLRSSQPRRSRPLIQSALFRPTLGFL